MDGLFLSKDTFDGFSSQTQAEILVGLGIATRPTSDRPPNAEPPVSDSDEAGPTSFTTGEMRKFIDGCGAKTRKVLEGLAELSPRFKVGDLLKKLNMNYGDLRGVQAGLTKRTRTISGNPNAWLFRVVHWDDDPRKSISELHPQTHEALRKILKRT